MVETDSGALMGYEKKEKKVKLLAHSYCVCVYIGIFSNHI